jgi:CHAD domain-containing protein
LRVGLRRLRTALQLFQADGLSATIGEPAAALFRTLGAARDAAVAQPLAAALRRSLAAAGMTLQLPTLLAAPDAAVADPTSAVRAPATQALLLELLSQVQSDAATVPGETTLRDVLATRLNRWHRQVLADAARFAELDDAQRHVLRKRVKRLRYSVEFAQSLFAKRRVRAYLTPLRAVQERLGELNDAVVGLAAYSASADADSRALYAVGWLGARREALIVSCAPELGAFAEVKRFWKK